MTTAERSHHGQHAASTHETSELLLDAFHAAGAEEPDMDAQPSIEQIAAKEAAARLVFKTFMTRGLLGFDATPSASEGIRQLKIHAAARRSRYYPAPSGVAPALRMEVKREGPALQEERGRMNSDADFDVQVHLLLDTASPVASPQPAHSLERAPTLVSDHTVKPERLPNTPRVRSLASSTTSTRTPVSVQNTTDTQSARSLAHNTTLNFPRSKVRPTFATLSKASLSNSSLRGQGSFASTQNTDIEGELEETAAADPYDYV